MGFDQQSYDNHLRASALAAQKFGPGWMNMQLYSTMDNPYDPIQKNTLKNANPNNPEGRLLRVTDPTYYWNADGQQPMSPGGEAINAPEGWDYNKFGNPAEWNATDTLPNGQTVQQYEDQLKAFQWPTYSSAPSMDTSIGGFLKAGIASPGIAPVLMAAGAGQLLGGGGFNPSAIDASWGSQAGNLGNLSGGAAAGGAGMDFSALSDAITGFNPDPFGAGPGFPDFGLENTFDFGANAGLPGAGSSAGGNWWDAFVGQGGSPFSSVPGGGLNGSPAPSGSSWLDKIKQLLNIPSSPGGQQQGSRGITNPDGSLNLGNLATILGGAFAGSQTQPNVVGQANPNYNAAIAQQAKLLNGDYLNPATNPAIQGQLQQLGDQYATQALPQAMSQSYKSSGMSGPLFGNSTYFNPSDNPAISGGGVLNSLNQSFGRGAGQILSQGYQSNLNNMTGAANNIALTSPIYGNTPLGGAISGGLGAYGLLNQSGNNQFADLSKSLGLLSSLKNLTNGF